VYFDNPELQGKSRELVSARHASEQGGQIARARGFFAAAKLERSKGMELLGFEGDPDYLLYEGAFDLNSPFTYDAEYNAVPHPRADLKIVGDYTSDDERSRVAGSKAAPLARFHYRASRRIYCHRARRHLPRCCARRHRGSSIANPRSRRTSTRVISSKVRSCRGARVSVARAPNRISPPPKSACGISVWRFTNIRRGIGRRG